MLGKKYSAHIYYLNLLLVRMHGTGTITSIRGLQFSCYALICIVALPLSYLVIIECMWFIFNNSFRKVWS